MGECVQHLYWADGKTFETRDEAISYAKDIATRHKEKKTVWKHVADVHPPGGPTVVIF